MTLTNEDFAAIRGLIREELNEELAPIKTNIDFIKYDIDTIKTDIKHLKFDVLALRQEIDTMK